MNILKDTLKSDPSQSAESNWGSLAKTIHSSAIATYGKKEHNNTDWYEANIAVLEPILDAKCKALTNYKHDPSKQNQQTLKAARSKAQQAARQYANDYWLVLANKIRLSLRHWQYQSHV